MMTEQTKACYKCKQEKPNTTKYFYHNKMTKDGLQNRCKQCRKPVVKRYNQSHKIERNQHRRQWREKYHKTIEGFLSRLWHRIGDRCNNPRNIGYQNYGGRGIRVKFASLNDFRDYIINELKVDPRGLTIDRINNDGNYERGNIRFVSKAENNRNR